MKDKFYDRKQLKPKVMKFKLQDRNYGKNYQRQKRGKR